MNHYRFKLRCLDDPRDQALQARGYALEARIGLMRLWLEQQRANKPDNVTQMRKQR